MSHLNKDLGPNPHFARVRLQISYEIAEFQKADTCENTKLLLT